MLLSGSEMRELEKRTFEVGTSPEALMEEAGAAIARAITQIFLRPGTCILYAGHGHNGGDAWVAARHLIKAGWVVQQRPVFEESKLSELTFKKKSEALACTNHTRPCHSERSTAESKNPANDGLGVLVAMNAQTGEMVSHLQQPIILLDGLLGIGATGLLRESIRAVTREMNRLRLEAHAHTFAIDLPTGLNADTGEADPDCVIADFTLAIGYAKTGLVQDSAVNYVGRLVILPLLKLTEQNFPAQNKDIVAEPRTLAPLLKRRKFNTYKTECGRVAVVAGSPGMTGAAIMCANAAVRGGAGLVTLFTTRDLYPILAAGAMPEVMVRPVDSYLEVLEIPCDAIAIGPGLGKYHETDVLRLIKECNASMVVDADALNYLSKKIDLLHECAGSRLLTPHPGEMERLFKTGNRTRSETVTEFTCEYPVTLLLKGARTVIGEKGRPHSYNSTGTPGMATGGMGDILTGVCAALIAQSLVPYDAARTGAWLCGRAAELAIAEGNESEESLAATDLLVWMGTAFKQLFL